MNKEQILKDLIKKDGSFKTTKPKDGHAAYVWRMVMFTISSDPKHHCMPVNAVSYIPKEDREVPNKPDRSNREQYIEWIKACKSKEKQTVAFLDTIVDEIIATIPKDKHYGTKRWVQAFGL